MDALEAVGDPELRDALAFVRGEARSITSDELAAAQRVHRNVARSRLERLADAGLLEVGYERRTGREGPGAGRPAKTYAAAPELAAIEFPERGYPELVGALLDTLPVRGRDAKLREAGATFARQLVGTPRRRPASRRAALEAMCSAVRRAGFQVAVEDVTDDGATLVTPTCPLRPLVRARKDAAAIDEGMWAGFAALFTGEDVLQLRCETHGCGGGAACRVRLRF
ncbi:MAG TPA: hypothetical protein VFW85_01710 [Gaiellaceae bacterium]|nr:hypothetical protein [Gaiellaceae bacterium]